MTGRVDKLWHKDQDGQCHPQRLVGTNWVHTNTANLYTVTGFSFNVTYDAWDIVYYRHDEEKRGEFGFTRRMSEFLDGRFIKVE